MARWRIGLGVLFLVVAGCANPSRRLNAQGVARFESGDCAAAQGLFYQAIEHDYGNADAYYNLGSTLHRRGQHEMAEWYYGQCLARARDHARCRHALAVLQVEQGRVEDALAAALEWAAESPSRPEPHVELGWLERQVGSPDRARAYLDHALELNPRHARALAELASLYETTNQLDRAAELYARSLDADPRQTNVAERLASLRGAGSPVHVADRRPASAPTARAADRIARDLRYPYQ